MPHKMNAGYKKNYNNRKKSHTDIKIQITFVLLEHKTDFYYELKFPFSHCLVEICVFRIVERTRAKCIFLLFPSSVSLWSLCGSFDFNFSLALSQSHVVFHLYLMTAICVCMFVCGTCPVHSPLSISAAYLLSRISIYVRKKRRRSFAIRIIQYFNVMHVYNESWDDATHLMKTHSFRSQHTNTIPNFAHVHILL